MDIFWNHTSNKEMQSLLTATLSQVRGQVWKGVALAHNIVGRPTLETNNFGAPVSQCILSDQGEILAKKNMSPLFTYICFSWRSNTIIMDLLSRSIILWSSWDFHDNWTGISTCWQHLAMYCRGSAIYNIQLQPGLSLRHRCQGFPLGSYYERGPRRKIEEK